MGFKEAKSRVIDCLRNGRIRHEARDNIDIKNLLATGKISPGDVEALILRARGSDYSSSPHDFDQEIPVHIITVTNSGKRWYIKWYFIEPDAVFISVHQ